MWRSNLVRTSSIVLMTLALGACGGGGDGGDGPPPPPPPPPTSFTVGGSASSLAGNLVLRLNGANDITVTGAGSSTPFTFATPALANGAAFDVSIFTQPASQVCAVSSGGSGNIAGANVTNVSISCASVSVGGTVAGLTKTGLSLQLNNANDLPVDAASATFTFPASSTLGGIPIYSVHIKAQPAGQTCTILKSTGILTPTAATVSGANGPAVECSDNVTDPFSGTFRITDGEPDTEARAFLTFNPDGTFIFGVHHDDPACGASKGNGVQYGVYNWNQATQQVRFTRFALDTVTSLDSQGVEQNCGIDHDTAGTLTGNSDGTLTFIGTDGTEPEEDGTLVPVAAPAGSLDGSWGDNQGFVVFGNIAGSSGKFFFVTSKAIVQIGASSPGIEDGCFTLSATTVSGNFTTDLGASCPVNATIHAADTTGAQVGFSGVSRAITFAVNGDAMQAYAGPVTPLYLTSAHVAPASLPSNYSVSASISGLTASGLVLQDNGASSAAVTAGATRWTVASGIQSRHSYLVTVQTQPAGQYCTVANGSGVVFANVTSVAVTCTTPPATTYTVSGAIAGYTGTGLALRLNGQATADYNVTPANAGTSYQFGAALTSGVQYSVIVTAQPTTPAQLCFSNPATPALGTINDTNITVNINCVNSAPYHVGGTVSGLAGGGLSLRMSYTDIYSAITTGAPALAVASGAGNFSFPDLVPASGVYDVGILQQPAGQTCTIARGRGIAIANVGNLQVTCVNNTTDALAGTYSLLNDQGRQYLSFNPGGTYTTALLHNDWRCNTDADHRNGNGVEYGAYTWTKSTGKFQVAAPAVVDTNGSCGLYSADGSFDGFINRVGNTIELRDTANGPLIATAAAVESDPASLVGAFVREADDGGLVVFHADGTYLSVETQLPTLAPLLYGQERGCYSIAGSSVTLRTDAGCRPDGLSAYDLNLGGGFVSPAAPVSLPLPFTIDGNGDLTLGGIRYRRSLPN